ncbi:MAG TPA: formate dehydrogenase [Burkholderiales bacterium]|jgi:hypothetical protein|nr:formate dehydrogenase [Burkholderiales bacterium]
MSQKKPILSRRNFLLSVGAGSAATAAAVISKKSPEVATSASDDKRATRGYQETAHVTNYYRTTKV